MNEGVPGSIYIHERKNSLFTHIIISSTELSKRAQVVLLLRAVHAYAQLLLAKHNIILICRYIVVSILHQHIYMQLLGPV